MYLDIKVFYIDMNFYIENNFYFVRNEEIILVLEFINNIFNEYCYNCIL